MQHDIRAFPRTMLVATSLVATLSLGCQNEASRADQTRADQKDKTAARTPSVTAATPEAPSVDAVREAPSQFYGKKVRLTGEVDKILTDRAFELEGSGWAFHDNITVFTKTAVQMSGALLGKGDEVVVTGTVQPFVTADIERDIGWDISQETEIKLKERPVLIADSIRKVSESGRWTAEGAAAQPIATVVALITTMDVTALAGQQVDLGRERVLAVTTKGMWVGPSTMSQIFVLPTTPLTNIKPGDTVQVSGTLRKVPANAGALWDLPPALASAAREGTIFVDDATVRAAAGATAQATPE
jgi:uncharacterized protein YdeI (BOF family)